MGDINDMNTQASVSETLKKLETAVEKLTGEQVVFCESGFSSSTLFSLSSAESEVRKLHHKYGYYLDKCLYKEVRGSMRATMSGVTLTFCVFLAWKGCRPLLRSP